MGLAASRQEAFWEACGFGHVERVKKFLTEDIDVNWKSYTHDCCAIHVASQGKPKIVDLLLEAGCDVNVCDDRGNLALHHAAMKGHAEIMKTLIKAGSEINAQDKNGWTSLHCAAYWAHPNAVRVLIEAGIDVHLQNKDERTALHETARSKEELDVELGEITRDLIKAGCDINAKSSDEGEADFTPLMFAAYHGHPEVASALIDGGCELNSRGTNLWTALHWAADRQNEEVAYILLEAGADPTCKGLRGELAADRSPSNPDLREMLLNAINMFSELSSLGGVNSQVTSPVIETCTGLPKLATPLADSEDTDIIEREASSENAVSEESNLDTENSSELTENRDSSPSENSKNETESLGNSLKQKLVLADNPEECEPSEPNEITKSDAFDEFGKGDNSDTVKSSSVDATAVVSCGTVHEDSYEGTTKETTDTCVASALHSDNTAHSTSDSRTPDISKGLGPNQDQEGLMQESKISG